MVVGLTVTPAVSSSVTVTVTLSAVIPSYPPPLTVLARGMISLAPLASWPAVTVTVCSTFQSDVVKVRVVLSRVNAVPAKPETATVTSPVGWVSSTTV